MEHVGWMYGRAASPWLDIRLPQLTKHRCRRVACHGGGARIGEREHRRGPLALREGEPQSKAWPGGATAGRWSRFGNGKPGGDAAEAALRDGKE